MFVGSFKRSEFLQDLPGPSEEDVQWRLARKTLPEFYSGETIHSQDPEVRQEFIPVKISLLQSSTDEIFSGWQQLKTARRGDG